MSGLDDFAVLGELLKDEVLVKPSMNVHGNMVLELAEPQNAGRPVILSSLPRRLVVVKADMFSSPGTVFKNTRGECKRADYVIIAEKDNNRGKFIILLEMKSGTGDSEREIQQQLSGAQCFIEYCRAIGRTFWKADNFLEGFQYRFVSIRKMGCPKQPTRVAEKSVPHDRPERMLKLSSPNHLEFNHLAGKR